FRTCRTPSDCSGATYCATWGDSHAMLLGAPTCVDSVCDWAMATSQACSGGQLCWPSGCATVSTGQTSGGFPWGTGGTCGGGGGCGGPGSGGKGGTGTMGAGGTGGTGGTASSGPPTCVNGDIQYTSGGQRQTHVCPNHDCF